MTRAHELRTRKDYLQTLVDWDADPATNGMVRVISGVRRSGKSSLLELYKQHVGSEKVVSVNFEDFSTLGLREAQRFHEEMTARIAATGATHLHVDEVQELDDWSQVINSLRLHENLTITVTGSNASMFVGEGLTYLAGRYIQLEMFPLSLHEYSSFAPEAPSQPSARYAEWMRGTLPAAAQAGSPKIRREINNAIFDSIFARDIALRGAIKDPDIFMRVARFVFDNVGSQLSAHKIANYLTSAGAKTTQPTVERYLGLLVDAHMLYRCGRFDVRGKAHLKGGAKYYFVDPGLRDVLLGANSSNAGHDLENMVYLELLRRGFSVAVGNTPQGEVDFVVTRDKERYYVQVALTALDDKTLHRELSSFRGLPAGSHCILLTFDAMPLNTGEVVHLHAADFLDGAPLR